MSIHSRTTRLMAQLESQRRTTEHHDQGLRAAAASSVMQAEALEDMRRRTSARWHAFTAAPPPLSVQVPAALGVQMVYGFQEVPKAPTFNGSTKVQKRRFMDQFEAYMREIRLANAQRPGGQQVYQMPLSGCIDPLSVEHMTKLNQAMGKLRMDTSILSSESRVSKLVSDFEATLVRLNMEGFAESEPKLTVDFLMAAIMPPAVQKRVRELMKLYENRGYKKDARAFKNWLAEYMRRYGEFEPLVQATPLPPRSTPTSDKTGDKDGRGGRGRGGRDKTVAVVNVDRSVIPPRTLQMLKDAGRDAVVTDLLTPVVVRGFVGPSHTVTQEVKLTLKFETDVGSLVLANVKCWLSVGNLPTGVGDILLSRPIMHRLGYDPQSMLREAAAVCSEYDMEDVESTSGVFVALTTEFKVDVEAYLSTLTWKEGVTPMKTLQDITDYNAAHPDTELNVLGQSLTLRSLNSPNQTSSVYLDALALCQDLDVTNGIEKYIKDT
ncbi:hypothetical protein DYB25_006383 [Aphanomyces astaci]|uniref:Uncharacterized protein n=2 Tax=Aphanomyces astaci TaxID=112090 RepID=A0A397BP44_APHAT|nr:hypothetical protein DYB25_006383 [Aphanomyces astaci]